MCLPVKQTNKQITTYIKAIHTSDHTINPTIYNVFIRLFVIRYSHLYITSRIAVVLPRLTKSLTEHISRADDHRASTRFSGEVSVTDSRSGPSCTSSGVSHTV